MVDDKRIPSAVIVTLFAYRDAGRGVRDFFERYRETARNGDRGAHMALERQREAQLHALDRAKRELDEAVREWADRRCADPTCVGGTVTTIVGGKRIGSACATCSGTGRAA